MWCKTVKYWFLTWVQHTLEVLHLRRKEKVEAGMLDIRFEWTIWINLH